MMLLHGRRIPLVPEDRVNGMVSHRCIQRTLIRGPLKSATLTVYYFTTIIRHPMTHYDSPDDMGG